MASQQRSKQGHLTIGVTDRANGRKIDTWTFRPGDVAGKRERDKEIVFEVHMLKSMAFSVDTKGIPSERWSPLVGPVLADLHAQALAAARAEFDLKNDLSWSDWLEIKVREASRFDARDTNNIAQASLSYRQIARAETPDGIAYTVSGNGLLTRFPEPVGVYRDPDGLTGNRRPCANKVAQAQVTTPENSAARLSAMLGATDRREADTQFAYLPDTPENRAGLDAIIAAIEGINLRLQQFLHPDEIGNTLQRALSSGTRLLAGPGETAAPASKRKPSP